MVPWTLDFETEPIDFLRPHRAPAPVGLAVRSPGGQSWYYAWGHPEGNGAFKRTRSGAVRQEHADPMRAWQEAREAWDAATLDALRGRSLLFHHAQSDLAVAEQHWDEPLPPPASVEDTRILAFLADPYRQRLGLKELAEDLLGAPPDEQEALYAWIRAHVPEARRKKNVGAWIGSAPGALVAPYAIGDVDRTYGLWRLFQPVARAFARAYRELEIPMLFVAQDMTERGVPADGPLLERFAEEAPRELAHLERTMRRQLQAPGLDFQDSDAVCDALEARGWVKPDAWVLTKKTRYRSLNHEDVSRIVAPGGRAWAARWQARQYLAWLLGTYCLPWLARLDRGRVHVSWNTTRHGEAGKSFGAKTGRLSSSPNLQNAGKDDPPGGLPNPRTWVRAPRGYRIVGGDVRQQEPSITSHYAGGRMREALCANPDLDTHLDTAELLGVSRGKGKTLGLAATYALGLDELARRLGCSRHEASQLRRAFFAVRPEVQDLDDALKAAWSQGQAIVTWAGVEVKMEPNPEQPGRWAYRALNTLIQRSAAEQLKAAMVTAWEQRLPLVLSVHDELVLESPYREARQDANLLEAALTGTDWYAPWTVPFQADVKVGRTWRDVK